MIFDISDQDCVDYVESFTNKRKFLKDFKAQYTFIKAYHATKLSDQERESIKQNGLLTVSVALLKQKAINRFVKTSDSEPLQVAMCEEVNTFLNNDPLITIGEINLGLEMVNLVHDYYHYLLFGSESLLPLADRLKNKFGLPMRSRMIEFGSSYLITANVPIRYTNRMWILCIYQYINEGFPECSLVYHNHLPPENIIEIKQLPRPIDTNGFEFM